jgi:hypothetical protein
MSIGSPPARIEIFLRDSSYFTHALFLPRFRHRLWVGLGDLSFTELSTELVNQIIDAVSAASFHSVYLYTAAEKNDIVQTIPHEDLNLFERVERALKTLSKASFKTSIDNNRCCLHRFAQFMYTAEKNDIIHSHRLVFTCRLLIFCDHSVSGNFS